MKIYRLWSAPCIQTSFAGVISKMQHAIEDRQRLDLINTGYRDVCGCFGSLSRRCIIEIHIVNTVESFASLCVIFYYEIKWSRVFRKEVYIYIIQ